MLKEQVLKILQSVDVTATPDILEAPPQEEYGDIAFPCFDLAKIRRKSPNEIANDIVKSIQVSKHPLLLKVEARGPYVNFFLYWEKIAEKIITQILLKKKIDIGGKKKVMVEYSQPNPVHPMHIGHARGTFLGDALANTYNYLGYKAIKANYMNDVGLQVARLVTAYKIFADSKKPKGKPDAWLWQYYVKFHDDLEKHPEYDEKARELLRKFELDKEPNAVKMFNKIVGWCVKGFNETYKSLGIKFDIYFYESDFRDAGKAMVDEALQRNIAFKSPEGAIVADLEKHGLPNTILLRSDGTGLYITSDLGLTAYKFKKYNLNESVWTVSSQQNLHFKQLFKVLELLGYGFVKRCHHLSFEHINLPEGKMSSREGRAVMIDEVIESLAKQALEEVEKRNPKLPKQKKLSISNKIAIGALKYAILKIETQSPIIFDWKQMLSFDGDTGPYLQYAYTRCMGILRKAKKYKKIASLPKLNQHEIMLTKKLSEFSDVVVSSATQMKPNVLCNYTFDLATEFNSFYEKCHVLSAEDVTTRDFRLTLVQATKDTMKKCLELLAMPVPEKM
ncbi:arginine--tRNA ligase [archaeon]|nr:MAG: arginine--tRNA ligase [archaeon]